MRILIYILIGIAALLFLLGIVYVLLLIKIEKLNSILYKKKEEINLTNGKNILIIYQPSRHKTTLKITEIIKEYLLERQYGYKITTLHNSREEYDKYEYTIFVAPVYFGAINNEFINKAGTNKIKKLIVIYNGMNKDNEKEDKTFKKFALSKYSKIKLNTTNIEKVKDFLVKEGL